MAEKRGQYQYNDDGTSAQLVAGDISIEESKAIVPVDIQARLSQTIQTHTNVVVAGSNGINDGSWIDTDGFNSIAITMKNDAATSSSAEFHWSHDNGSSRVGVDTVIGASTANEKSAIMDTRARYMRIRLNNLDASPHTMSAFAYLKA